MHAGSRLQTRDALIVGAGAAPSKKDVLYNLSNPDPDAEASVKAYLTSLYKGAKLEPTTADDSLELTSKIEKKYKAAAIVEYGLQVRRNGVKRRKHRVGVAHAFARPDHADPVPHCRPSPCPWATPSRTWRP